NISIYLTIQNTYIIPLDFCWQEIYYTPPKIKFINACHIENINNNHEIMHLDPEDAFTILSNILINLCQVLDVSLIEGIGVIAHILSLINSQKCHVEVVAPCMHVMLRIGDMDTVDGYVGGNMSGVLRILRDTGITSTALKCHFIYRCCFYIIAAQVIDVATSNTKTCFYQPLHYRLIFQYIRPLAYFLNFRLDLKNLLFRSQLKSNIIFLLSIISIHLNYKSAAKISMFNITIYLLVTTFTL
ncbi:hypothetical protein ACJX0J_020412, partial [Zea mays]